jgi:hypothetical protein
MKELINTACNKIIYIFIECVKLLETAIAINIQNNRVSNVAKIQKRIA